MACMVLIICKEHEYRLFMVNGYNLKGEHSKLNVSDSLFKGRPLQQKRIFSPGALIPCQRNCS